MQLHQIYIWYRLLECCNQHLLDLVLINVILHIIRKVLCISDIICHIFFTTTWLKTTGPRHAIDRLAGERSRNNCQHTQSHFHMIYMICPNVCLTENSFEPQGHVFPGKSSCHSGPLLIQCQTWAMRIIHDYVGMSECKELIFQQTMSNGLVEWALR